MLPFITHLWNNAGNPLEQLIQGIVSTVRTVPGQQEVQTGFPMLRYLFLLAETHTGSWFITGLFTAITPERRCGT